jgi:3-deoxy-manno-octulosonate cytidylyltransferase (CMP-KDO synthetase)
LIAGKPLLQRVIEGSRSSLLIRRLMVATDDHRIAELARSLGVEVAMTPSELPTGTDRVWQAVRSLDVDVVVNIQGDEPLIEGWVLDRLIEPFAQSGVDMATLGRPLTHEALESPNTAKIVVSKSDEALYFSRYAIPYSRVDAKQVHEPLDGALQHVGIYAYRKRFLERFCAQEPVSIEKAESLEQLRALYLGARIKVVRVDHESWGVDTPADVQKIEMKLSKGGNRNAE